MKRIASGVLNHNSVIPLCFRKLSIPDMIYSLGQTDTNILIIGKEASWLVNAKTAHCNFFIGTERKIKLGPTLRNS